MLHGEARHARATPRSPEAPDPRKVTMDLHTLVEALEAARLAEAADVTPYLQQAARDERIARDGAE